MNASTTNQGGARRSWLDVIEENVNRVADALGVDKLNERIEAFAHSIARRFSPKRG